MKIAEVHWIDAYASTSETDTDEAEGHEGVYTITVGFLLAETTNGITLAMDWWPKSPKEGKVHTFIPWEMVLKWYVYTGVPTDAPTARRKKPR